MAAFSLEHMLALGQILYVIWFLTETTHTLNNQYRGDTPLINVLLCLYIGISLKVYDGERFKKFVNYKLDNG